GTRGCLDVRTRRHFRHTSTAVERRGRRFVVDCGEDWRGRADRFRADVIFLTHAPPDHAWGLEGGAPCPVWATESPSSLIGRFPSPDALRFVVEPRRPVEIEGVTFEGFPVVPSIRCPAVGYRVTADGASIFYVPDVVHIPERAAAFDGIAAYVGDG